MRVGLVTIVYREGRLISPFLNHIPEWVDETLVLASEKPWFGKELPDDGTIIKARKNGATVIEHPWKTEEDQRNAGQEYFTGFDWVIILDPDEFLDDNNWENLKALIDSNPQNDAFVVDHQRVYWKDGWHATPDRDYQQLILVRPGVRFVDKRVVGSSYAIAPVVINHFSWAKTDDEVWNKISHYAHANDFNTEHWYETVWKLWKPGDIDVHPTSPETLHEFERAVLPPELERLKLWP
jgi:glycosyltransferase involved in cell wall biosynthesis